MNCKLLAHHAGLFSLVNCAITCLSIYDHVHVDWTGCIYGAPEDGNIWDHLFTPTAGPETPYEVVTNYPHQLLTYKNAALLYQGNGLTHWRQQCHRLWNRMGLRDRIANEAHRFITQHLEGGFTALLIRSNIHAGEQISGMAQTKDDYAWAIDRHAKGRIYVAAGDTESLEWFKDRFEIITHPEVRRSDSRNVEVHLQGNQTVRDAELVLVEALIMSRAEAFIHPISNIATSCLYINPDLKSIYLP